MTSDRPPASRPAADTSRPTRRLVLGAGLAAAAGALPGLGSRAVAEEDALPTRPLGRTGKSVTLFGLGCFPLGSLQDEEAAVAIILRAIDAGCTYLDTAPSYADGRSELRVGKALAQRPKASVVLATKTHTRTSDDARRDLEGSLKRLGVDRVDLVQVHAVKDAADLERVVAPGGPVDALVKAREEGLVEHIGVTGHADPVVMRQAIVKWPFEVLLLPLNCVDPHYLPFESQTLPTAIEKGIGRVAMKVFASGNLPSRGIDSAACLRYVYQLNVATVVVGCRTIQEVDEGVRIARERHSLSPEEKRELLAKTHPHRGRTVEWYKRAP